MPLPYIPSSEYRLKRSIHSRKTFTPVNIDFKHILAYNCGKYFTIYLLSVLVTMWICEGFASSQERDDDPIEPTILIHMP